MLSTAVSDDSPVTPGFLLVVTGADPGRLHALDKTELVIGRSKYADVRVQEKAISQQHAKLIATPAGHRIIDLGSTNGTFVNDERVEQANLKTGDVVRTGETVFTYMSSAKGSDAANDDKTMALPAAALASFALAKPATALPVRPLVPAPSYPATVLHAPDAAMQPGPDLLTMLVRAWAFVGRYWLMLLLLTLTGVAAGVGSYHVLPPWSTAEFKLQLLSEASNNPVEQARRHGLEFFRSASQNFMRPDLMRETLAALGATDASPQVVNKIQRRLSFERERMAPNVYTGTYEAPTEHEAQRFLTKHLELYLTSEINKGLRLLVGEVETLQHQVDEAAGKLLATEKEIVAFKQQHTEGLPEQAAQLYQELFTLQNEKSRAESEVARAAAELAAKRRHSSSNAPQRRARQQDARPYETEITKVNRDLAALRASGKGDAHPDVRSSLQLLASLEQQRDEVLRNGTGNELPRHESPAYAAAHAAVGNAQAEHEAARADLSRLVRDHEKMRELVTDLPALQARYAELTREYETMENVHHTLLEKLNASKLQLELERNLSAGRYDLIVPPTVQPLSPASHMLKRGGAFGVVGLLLAMAIALILELRRVLRQRAETAHIVPASNETALAHTHHR